MATIKLTRFCPLFLLEGFGAVTMTSLGFGFAFSSMTWAFVAVTGRDLVNVVMSTLLQRVGAMS